MAYQSKYTGAQIDEAVRLALSGELDVTLQEKTITENGEVTPDDGYDGLSKVTVDVPIGIPIEVDSLDNSLLISENVDKVYKYDDKLYQVNDITSLKGLTIIFNNTVTPCPVLNDTETFECSGVAMGGWYPGTTLNADFPNVTSISKHDDYLGVTGDIVFSVFGESYGTYVLYYNEGNSEWRVFDENANETPVKGIITNFDCPVLNENPEFIEWVLENANIYHKIETLYDISSFKLNIQTYDDVQSFGLAVLYALWNKINPDIPLPAPENYTMGNTFTTSFLLNGEQVVKTFSNLMFYNTKKLSFYNENNDSLIFESDYDTDKGIVKYNDTVLNGEVTFTVFDSFINDFYFLLDYVLTYSELGGAYVNGCTFKEYLLPTGILDITENGMFGVKEYVAATVNVPPIPAEVLSEEEMNGLLTSGKVGGVYEYTGETGVYENGAMYVLEDDTLQGTWLFNDNIGVTSDFVSKMNYISNNIDYTGLYAVNNDLDYIISGMSMNNAYTNDSWQDDNYKTINITSKITELSTSDIKIEGFIEWLNANAVKITLGDKVFKKLKTSDFCEEFAGVWVFNDTIDLIDLNCFFNFISSNTDYIGTYISASNNNMKYRLPSGTTAVYSDGVWIDETYKTIIITSNFRDIETAPPYTFLSWLRANATKQ